MCSDSGGSRGVVEGVVGAGVLDGQTDTHTVTSVIVVLSSTLPLKVKIEN